MCNCNLHARYVFDVSELYIWNQMGAVYVSADFLNSLCELNCKLIYLVDGTLMFGLLFLTRSTNLRTLIGNGKYDVLPWRRLCPIYKYAF